MFEFFPSGNAVLLKIGESEMESRRQCVRVWIDLIAVLLFFWIEVSVFFTFCRLFEGTLRCF